jgi:hypothetical protein
LVSGTPEARGVGGRRSKRSNIRWRAAPYQGFETGHNVMKVLVGKRVQRLGDATKLFLLASSHEFVPFAGKPQLSDSAVVAWECTLDQTSAHKPVGDLSHRTWRKPKLAANLGHRPAPAVKRQANLYLTQGQVHCRVINAEQASDERA